MGITVLVQKGMARKCLVPWDQMVTLWYTVGWNDLEGRSDAVRDGLNASPRRDHGSD